MSTPLRSEAHWRFATVYWTPTVSNFQCVASFQMRFFKPTDEMQSTPGTNACENSIACCPTSGQAPGIPTSQLQVHSFCCARTGVGTPLARRTARVLVRSPAATDKKSAREKSRRLLLLGSGNKSGRTARGREGGYSILV